MATLNFSNGPDINKKGTSAADVMNLLDGNDSANGLDGNDTMYGGAGDDTLNGDNGDDWVLGGTGNDVLSGGTFGNDTLLGEVGNDTLNGSYGSDYLDGGLGNDSIVGGLNAPDTMLGGAGNDTIRGEGIINGGTGADRLQSDNAVFVYDDGDTGVGVGNRDTIVWFHSENSKINVNAVDANTAIAGDQNFVFIGTSKAGAAFSAPGQILLMALDTRGQEIHGGNTAISNYVVQLNTDADLQPEMEILLEHWTGGNTALPSASWFIL
ncbi:calcium-binding protein [Paracraurococcus ruber]|nr:calcium-binding protein [Paracraurococcus ruber]